MEANDNSDVLNWQNYSIELFSVHPESKKKMSANPIRIHDDSARSPALSLR